MSNSNLVSYTKLSPNYTSMSDKVNKKITIHHMAGNLTVERCGDIFAPASRGASANYGIGSDGRIGLYVDESNRSWCSSSRDNDSQAITIEVANDGGAPDWHVSDAALESLINLCVDICQRNGISSLNYTGNTDGNLTRHNMFAATACPGPYLQSQFPYIAEQVNARLGASAPEAPESGSFVGGEEVKLVSGATYTSGQSIPSWLYNKTLYVREVRSNGDVVFSTQKSGAVTGVIRPSYLTKVGGGSSEPSGFTPYQVKVTATRLNYRQGPGTNYKINGDIRDQGVYTIIDQNGHWGKLKSGAGWIFLDYTKRV